ncbi:MAG: hypothetical protein WA840_19725 [Caulobacteraceae bacterium]
MGPSNVGRWAKVTAVHPEAHAVDLVFLDTGAQVPMAPVLSASIGTDFGLVDLPDPTPPAQPYDVQATGGRDVYAAVIYVGGLPVVVGFKAPEIGQLTFADRSRKISRHASDVYTSVDSQGNFELFHPSGTYLRIGATTGHEDLTGKDFDGLWRIQNNTATQPHIYLACVNGGAVKSSVDLDPGGDVTVTAQASVQVTAPAVGLSGVVTVNGNATVTGDLTVASGATGTFTTSSGATVTVQGGIITNIT